MMMTSPGVVSNLIAHLFGTWRSGWPIPYVRYVRPFAAEPETATGQKLSWNVSKSKSRNALSGDVVCCESATYKHHLTS